MKRDVAIVVRDDRGSCDTTTTNHASHENHDNP
jgi:hypothetical protein